MEFKSAKIDIAFRKLNLPQLTKQENFMLEDLQSTIHDILDNRESVLKSKIAKLQLEKKQIIAIRSLLSM